MPRNYPHSGTGPIRLGSQVIHLIRAGGSDRRKGPSPSADPALVLRPHSIYEVLATRRWSPAMRLLLQQVPEWVKLWRRAKKQFSPIQARPWLFSLRQRVNVIYLSQDLFASISSTPSPTKSSQTRRCPSLPCTPCQNRSNPIVPIFRHLLIAMAIFQCVALTIPLKGALHRPRLPYQRPILSSRRPWSIGHCPPACHPSRYLAGSVLPRIRLLSGAVLGFAVASGGL